MTPLEIPNFANWTTSRLKILLDGYKSDLSSCQVLLGKQHEETQLYRKWVQAIEEELARRNL